jgi:HlyD family secretion protein
VISHQSSVVGRRWSLVLGPWSLVLFLLAACSPRSEAVAPTFVPPPTYASSSVSTYTVEYGSIVETVEIRGRVVAKQEALLGFPLGGALKAIHVSPGDQVEEDAPLAELDAPQVEREVLVQQSELSLAELALAHAEAEAPAQVAQAQATLALKEAMLQQAMKGASAEDIAAAEAELASAKANYEKVQAGPTEEELIVAKADMAKAAAAVQKAQAEYDRVSWSSSVQALSQSVALQQASIDYERAKADYQMITQSPTESELKSAWAQVVQAQTELDKLRKKPEPEDVAIAQAQVDQAQASLSLVASTYDMEVDIAKERVERARAFCVLASEQLSSTLLLAPFSGIIISVEKRPGDQVQAYEPIGAIADPSELWVVAMVLEEDIDRITVGGGVTVRLDAYPDQEYTGGVLQVASQAIIWQGKSAYEVMIAFDEGQDVPATIRMGADVYIAGRSREKVLVVPAQAIMVVGGQEVVEVVGKHGGIARVEVQTGVSNGTETEIVAGLQAGQEIRTP